MKASTLAICSIVLSLSPAAGGVPAIAESYPVKPVRIVVPFPPGGPLDLTARLLSDRFSIRLKQPFIVENRPGAGGTIGTDAVARAPADGYTLLIALDTPLTVSPSLSGGAPFDVERDLRPISIVASFGQMLVAHPSLAASTVGAFVERARREPITYATGGSGTPGHLTMEYFRLQAGFEAVHVAYRGNTAAVLDVLAGRVPAGFLATPGVIEHVKAGTLRAIASSGSRRSQLAEDVPTIAESGFPGFEAEFYQVIAAPAGVPEAIAALLEAEARQALEAPEIRQRLRAHDLEPVGSTAAEAHTRIRADSARWARIVKAVNLRAD
jgi:tripartite-type tricarboxylate transporter receptor subunit TctC